MTTDRQERLLEAIQRDGRYPLEAYGFLHRGLADCSRVVHGDPEDEETPQHVTGQQLCHGLRLLAVQLWGPLAREVLARWNIRETRDFGEMVYLMIKLGEMGKQPTDKIEDFDDVYDFREAFDEYEIPLDQDEESD